ncbi:uncharacterized protein LOC129000387 [Macrosteles quadrilineatus]|uniref:uncharacterized protein LOC129000387 n=1 Tax=Macrosteles quadrilineatus TaxID=74068 RepID=UPI0023E1EFDC|nr:uncharacterized protein LOC129000387 [Macrosteles quadrilineatus]
MPSALSEDLETVLRGQGLFITNRVPTRGDRCIDSIASNLDVWDYSVEVPFALIADHLPVLMSVKKTALVSNLSSIPWHDNYVFYKRNVSDQLLPQFKEALSKIDWALVLDDPDPASSFQAFHSKLLEVFNFFFPLLNKAKPKSQPKQRSRGNACIAKDWYTPELGRVRAFTKLIFDRYKAEQSPNARDKLYSLYLKTKRNYKCQVNEAKKRATVVHIQSSLNQCKAAWSVINDSRKKNEVVNKLSSPDDYNQFFVNSVKDITEELSRKAAGNRSGEIRVQVQPLTPLEEWNPTTQEEVIKIVKSFSNSRSPDIYGISPWILKSVINEISLPLSEVINRCLRVGLFPDCLKISRTIPVFKKGDANLTSSYRPISIIPTVEKIVQRQIVDHFEVNHYFTASQHGFRKSRSTTTALVSLISEVLDSFENRQSMALVLCDLSKAFDIVSHDILLEKLGYYGVGGVALQTFKSYLEGRSQMVAVQGALSSPADVKFGVPQGSIVGPTLFLILMNDLGWDRDTLLFADDTTLLGRGQDPTEAVACSELNVFTVYNQYILACVVHIKTNLSNFELRGQLHSYNIRGAQKLNTQRYRLSLTRDSFPAVAVHMFNALPLHLRELEPKIFKERIKELLLQNPFYSVDEYFEEAPTLDHPPPSKA